MAKLEWSAKELSETLDKLIECGILERTHHPKTEPRYKLTERVKKDFAKEFSRITEKASERELLKTLLRRATTLLVLKYAGKGLTFSETWRRVEVVFLFVYDYFKRKGFSLDLTLNKFLDELEKFKASEERR